MQAVILAAGYATRLYPLTLDKPKTLLPVGGKSVLNYIIEKISEIDDIDEIFIVTNDKFYMQFVWWLNQNKFDKKIEIINDNITNNETRLGAIGDLFFAIREKNIDDDILVVASDNLFDFSLKEIVNFFKENKKVIVGLYELGDTEQAKKFGVIELQGNKIVGFEEKPSEPKTKLISTGIYIITKETQRIIEQYLKTDNSKKELGYLVKWLAEREEICGFKFNGKWFDIGTIEDYERAGKEW